MNVSRAAATMQLKGPRMRHEVGFGTTLNYRRTYIKYGMGRTHEPPMESTVWEWIMIVQRENYPRYSPALVPRSERMDAKMNGPGWEEQL